MCNLERKKKSTVAETQTSFTWCFNNTMKLRFSDLVSDFRAQWCCFVIVQGAYSMHCLDFWLSSSIIPFNHEYFRSNYMSNSKFGLKFNHLVYITVNSLSYSGAKAVICTWNWFPVAVKNRHIRISFGYVYVNRKYLFNLKLC